MDKKVAFFVDGGFFINRLRFFNRKYFPSKELTPSIAVKLLRRLIKSHQERLTPERDRYRSYYYDAPPFDKQIRYPLPSKPEHKTPGTKNYKKEPSYIFQTELHKLLGTERKMALRMGKLSNSHDWQLKHYSLQELFKQRKTFSDLTNDDFYLDIKQKGVDSRIGMDITSIALKGLADTVILMACDADFIPVAKLARTQGVDVILDPMHSDKADKDLIRHIDGKQSFDFVSILQNEYGEAPTIFPSWWETKHL